MEETSCSACHKRFQEESPPKVLECGHNVCAKCLEKFLDLDTGTLCAICQAEFTKKESWPTNHSLLSVSRFCNKLLNDEKHVKTAIAEFQEDIMEKVTAMTNEMNNTHCSNVEKVTALMKEIDNTHCITMEKVTAMTKDMNNALGSIRTYVETAKAMTLKMDDFEGRKDYLYEVYRRCKTGLVYAIYIIGKEEKFGQVTVFGNKILVHCASGSIPKEERSLTHVLFQDLKKSIGVDGFNVFLEISVNEFGLGHFIDVELIGGQSLDFIKLCTGETGPSYKGTLYTKGEPDPEHSHEPILCIQDYIFNGEKETGKIDYNLNYEESTLCEDEEYVVSRYNNDGSFDIVKMNSDKEYSNVYGKIVSPCNFLDKISFDSKIHNKILDCGIIFQIE